jgi:hypothetical protein
MRIGNNSQARRGCELWIPHIKYSTAICLSLRDMKNFVLYIVRREFVFIEGRHTKYGSGTALVT